MSNKVINLTPKQERLIEGSILNTQCDEQLITYSHSTLCQTSLPFRNMKEIREWEHWNGNACLLIKAGEVFEPNADKMTRVGLPYGAKPRLILNYLNRQAVLTQNPEIEIENSLHAFLKRIGIDPNGRNYSTVKDQLGRLCASSLTIGRKEADGTGSTMYTRIADKLNLFFHNEDKQKLLWPNIIRLNQDYFESLIHHAVPLDERAIALLRDSALEIDLYTMLAERLHRINPQKPHFVAWERLYQQYGSNYARIRDFRSKFLGHLKNVAMAYPKARVEEEKSSKGMSRGLKFHHSQPPILKKSIVVIKNFR